MLRRRLMLVTDLGMLAYWSVTALMAVGLVAIPGDWLFKDYHDPRVMAWNWSFLPLDLALSLTGLAALRLEARGDPAWPIWSAVSLALTSTAGLMAVAYWTIVRDFDPAWWTANLFLLIWPLAFLVRLVRSR